MTQTDLSFPVVRANKSQAPIAGSSDRTSRASTRMKSNAPNGNKDKLSFDKTLKDLANSGAISPCLLDILKEGFNS